MISALIVLACAVLNRARGDDRWMMGKLPGRALYYVAPAVGLVAWDWRFALAYLAWALPAWSRWFDLGRLADDFNREGIKPSPFETFIERISFGSDYLAFLWRHALVVPLLWWLVGPWALAFPLVVLAVYELAWRLRPRNPIILAELLTGALWGSFVLLGAA